MAFEYRIDGNQVQLTREGAPTVDAKLDRSGLGLGGDVVVIHNGQTVYEGASPPIRIDISANTARPFVEWRRRRGDETMRLAVRGALPPGPRPFWGVPQPMVCQAASGAMP